MGTGISICFASAGFTVNLIDASEQGLAKAGQRLTAHYQREVDKGRLKQQQAEDCLARINFTGQDDSLMDADLIIEAVYEDVEVKRSIFERLGKIAKPGAILATNTSSLDVNLVAECSGRRADVIGLHFFSPANIMRLLEIVRTDYVAADVLQTALGIARKIGKVPVVSGVCFGFIGNRMLEGYIREAEALLLEGASPQQIDQALEGFGFRMGPCRVMDMAHINASHIHIDQALEGFGFRMGPCRVMDMAGIDVGAKIVLEQKKANQLPADPNYRLAGQALYQRGRFGQKTGQGYYKYEGRNAIEDPEVLQIFAELAKSKNIVQRAHISNEEIVNRCVLPLILEGYKILAEGIAYRAGDIDVVWMTGYGFAAWRGGPMVYADARKG